MALVILVTFVGYVTRAISVFKQWKMHQKQRRASSYQEKRNTEEGVELPRRRERRERRETSMAVET